jgi:hypothetical protein
VLGTCGDFIPQIGERPSCSLLAPAIIEDFAAYEYLGDLAVVLSRAPIPGSRNSRSDRRDKFAPKAGGFCLTVQA